MEKNKAFYNFCKYFILGIFLLIIITLTFGCLIYTCTISDVGEITYYLKDSPIVHLIVFGLLISVTLVLKYNRNKFIWINYKNIMWTFFAIFSIIAVLWILCTQIIPKDDQEFVLGIANELHHGDTERYRGYVGTLNHQMPLIAILYFFQYIFGDFNYLAIQALNVIAILISVYAIVEICGSIFENKKCRIIYIICLFAFLPFDFYVTFVYGNLWGLALSLLAVLMMYRYFDNSKYFYLIWTMLLITLGVFVKSNYLIFMVAIVIFLFLNFIFKRKWQSLLSITMIIIFYFGSHFLLENSFEKITGVKLTEGAPSIAWVAMGLQETPMAPGWFNGYQERVMVEGGRDPKIAAQIAIENIKSSLNNFKENPQYAVEFFGKKTLSEWANPTFQCFWISKSTDAISNITESPLVSSVLKGKINRLLTFYMNIYQSLILEGTLCYIILGIKRTTLKELIFAVIFIGGFIFHLFWEAKAQYTFTYFILLIPYAIQGYNKIANLIISYISKRKKKLNQDITI